MSGMRHILQFGKSNPQLDTRGLQGGASVSLLYTQSATLTFPASRLGRPEAVFPTPFLDTECLTLGTLVAQFTVPNQTICLTSLRVLIGIIQKEMYNILL